MARVQPFSAWRYARSDSDLSAVTAPPYDVISRTQREELISRDPHNVVVLELPEGPLDPALPGNRYARGKEAWGEMRATGVLARDASPQLYVLEQSYEIAGRTVRRRAFIAEVGIEPFEADVIIPHERTLPKALGDRFELIKATGANLSPVFGLFDDPACTTDVLFDEVMSTKPVASATDDDVTSVLWACADSDVAGRLTNLMADKRIFIADGHHRYTTALAYRDLRREQEPTFEGDAPWDFVMMALVSMDDPDLTVLPYHRIADAPSRLDSAQFYERLGEFFDVTELPPGHPSSSLTHLERQSFLVKTRDDERARLAVLRAGIDLAEAIPLDRSTAWKDLDVTVLQELVLWPLLGIHPDHPETLDRISFTKDAHEALRETSVHDVAFILRPTALTQLKEVSLSGETMPQKSTYFYPKLPSGLVLRSAE